ncbi:MAG: hypothetical protein VX239_02435, partial [Candidatus Thermoplasmatota archaeon]|nr:hypothetical protein [Candidatus Thermoplasmatota archaeon]
MSLESDCESCPGSEPDPFTADPTSQWPTDDDGYEQLYALNRASNEDDPPTDACALPSDSPDDGTFLARFVQWDWLEDLPELNSEVANIPCPTWRELNSRAATSFAVVVALIADAIGNGAGPPAWLALFWLPRLICRATIPDSTDAESHGVRDKDA